MIRRPPRSTLSSSSAASDVYKRQRLTTVKESSDVPVSVPPVFFDCSPNFINQYGVAVCSVNIIHFTTDWYDLLQCRAQHPAKPNAFSLSFITHSIHAIVPISSTNQRQSMFTKSESIFHRTDTVVIKGETFNRGLRLAISVIITLFYQLLLQVRYFTL